MPVPRAIAVVMLSLASTTVFAADADADGIEFFERKVRPLFADHCFSCHGEKKQKGELRLDSPAAIRKGGESGEEIVPGEPEKSRLIVAVGYLDADLQMPPKKRLTERQVAELTEWVKLGAPMPAGDLVNASAPMKKEFAITEKDRAHWAFQPLKRDVGSNSIDAFINAKLAEKGLAMSPEADARTLCRRIYFDLIGLPPTPEEVEAFASDYSPAPHRSYEALVDKLLASPQYGERWGRHWLDVARYAQSNGYERDGEKLLAWRYRDYVIKAFYDDKPYDRFVMEQIAGDELPDATAESVVATAFQRLGVFNDEPDDKRMAEFEALDDVLSTSGAAFLGLTIGCARCHDHKFDPIPQSDYYSMLAFFRGLRPYESERTSFDAPGFAPLAPPREVQAWLAEKKAKAKPLEEQLAAAKDTGEKKRLKQEIKKLGEDSPFEWTLAAREAGPYPPPTHVFVRGNASTPGAEVQPAFLSVLGSEKPNVPVRPADAPSSGRRLALAHWIASPQNPLTARVMVNRVWQHHFGNGLVKTTSDFGRAGSPPTHPQLLDALASEFIEGGWSVKKLHRLIMTSQTYRQSSRADNARALALDPANDLLWRQNLRRLEAEAVRDSLLSIAGTLNPAMGGRGFFPYLSGEVLAGQSRPGLDWEVSSEAEQSRRSVYAYVRRTMAVPLLETLDYSNTTSPLAERVITTVAPQALTLLNDEFIHRQAVAFAERLVREAGIEPDAQIRRAYQLAVNRGPTPREMQIAIDLLRRQTNAFAALPSHITFRPDVANALSTDYFAKLQPMHFLVGPRESWSYHRGFWASAYEGIRVVDRQRAPFALWGGTSFTDGIVEATITLSAASELAGLLVRTKAEGDDSRGYEVVLDPRQQRIALRRHAAEVTTVAEAGARIPLGKPFAIRIESIGAQIRVSLNGEQLPVLDTHDHQPIPGAGQIGVRTWGGAITLDNLAVTVLSGGGGEQIAVPSGAADPARRALQSFCLLVLNLNEGVYVD
jgi:mono/diheme cytochrome c family protein